MKLPDIIYKIYSSVQHRDLDKRKYPRIIDIGFTNFCNLQCEMCPNYLIKKKRGFMDEDLFKSIVDTIVDKFERQTYLGIGLFGEALLHPKFVDFLNYANKKKVKLKIATNCVSLTNEIAESLTLSCMRLLEISFYSLKKERYNKMVGRRNYDLVFKNVHKLLSIAEKNQFSGKIRLRPLEKYSDELENYKREFYSKYKKLNFELPEPKRLENWTGYVKLKKISRFYIRRTCTSVFSRFAIDWDGEIKLCCKSMIANDLSLGHINKHYTVYDVWHSQEYATVIEKFKKIDYSAFPSCLACQDTKRYLRLSDIKKIFRK